ncbi:MAG: hypothetical protein ACE367_12700 [Acidimicrobiales bacterium]
MSDQVPEPGASGEPTGGRNQWDFEAPDPSLSFHGDIPTGPEALQDRPTGDAAVPPTAVPPTAVPPTAVPPNAVPPTAVPAVPPTEAVPGAADPAATRVVPAAVPPTAAPPGGAPPGKRVGTRTAAMAVGVAALAGLLIVVGLALAGGDGGEVVATDTTPRPAATAQPTAEPTAEPTPEASPTPAPTATPEPPSSVVANLPAATTAFGGEVAERWDLTDGRLTSTVEISNGTDAAVEGLHVVLIPPSITDDPTTVTFDPEPTEVVDAADPAAAFAVALEPGDPPVTITWSADVASAGGETPETVLERLLDQRAAAAFRFAGDGPDLAVNTPEDGSTTIGSSVSLRGRTDPGATVTVAGDAVSVNAGNGRFRTEIERTRDRRQIAIVATDRYGRTTELTWTVRFADPAPTPTPRPVAPPPVAPPPPPTVDPPPPPQPTVCPPTDDSCR